MILATLVQDAVTHPTAGPMIGGAAAGAATAGSVGYLFVQSLLGRLRAVEKKVNRTAESVALIMGHLGVPMPAAWQLDGDSDE